MSWFFIALLGTLCFSLTGYIDKYLISKYLKSDRIGALMLFSAFFAILILPCVFIIERNILSVPSSTILFLILVGILSFIAILFYFKALTYTDTSSIIPYFQLIPVFGFIFGYFVLGEIIPTKTLIGGFIIILGSILLGFRKNESRFRFEYKVVFLMIGSSLTYALYEVLFKLVTVKESFLVSFFWQNVGLLLAGILLYIGISDYRKDFHDLIKNNGKRVLGLNLINEILNTGGVALIQYASLLVPIVLVLLVNSLQPMIVFILGVLLTLFLPKIIKEEIDKNVLIQKIIAILVISAGTYLLYY